MKLRWSPAAAGLLALGLGVPEARADDGTDLQTLLAEPVVQTASKTLETASSSPATSTILSADDMRTLGIRTLDEALNYLSLGMTVEGSQAGLEVGARGMLFTRDYGNHVLLLLDGHVVNEQWGGAAYFERGTGVPMEIVDHIEVILGPGSVLYGSNAVLGVINIITKRARDFSGVHVALEGELPISIRAAAGYGRELTLFGRRAELTTELEYYTRRGPSFAVGPQRYGDDSVTGLPKRFDLSGPGTGIWGGTIDDANFSVLPSGYARLVVGDFELNVRAALWKRGSPFSTWAFNDPASFELDRWLSADLRHRARLGSRAELSSRLYGDLYDYHQVLTTLGAEDCLSGQTRGCLYSLTGVASWVGLEEQLGLDWLRDGTLTTLLGVDGRLKLTGSKTDITDLVTGANPGSIGVTNNGEVAAAVYLEQKARLFGRLDLSAGARFDADQRFGTRLSPRLAAAVRPWDGGTIKLVYAEAFRAPTAYERYYADRTFEVPADDLTPEIVRSVEGAVEHRFKAQRVQAGVFGSWFHDIVTSQALTPEEIARAVALGQLEPDIQYAQQYRNIAAARSYGYHLAFEGAAVSGKLRYGLNITGAIARQAETENGPEDEIGITPQVFGNARVAYALGGDLPTLGLAGRYEARRRARSAFDGTYSPVPYAPPLAELRATVSGKVPKLTGLSYRLSANYSFADRAPYPIGPGSLDTTRAELLPLDRFRAAIALYYDLIP
ncbi:MAG: TonB-dependent receptor [Byssovorax sp.]